MGCCIGHNCRPYRHLQRQKTKRPAKRISKSAIFKWWDEINFLKGDDMSYRKIALITLIISAPICFFWGCENNTQRHTQTVDNWRPPALNLPEVSFDSKFAMISLDGFRIQMSARMAKQIAEEQVYKIDSSISDITFDDVINGELRESSVGPDIYLKRDNETVELSFDYGRLYSVTHKHMFYQRQQAEELLESYLKRYPELTLSNETENFHSYMYKSNKFAYIVVSIQMFGENGRRVSITVNDSNYSQSKRNQEYRQKYHKALQEYNDGVRQILY